MAKAAKKAVKPANKKTRTLDERLDFIEGMISAIAYVIMNAKIEVIIKKPTKKIVKKAKK